jgi:hypothetical protein
MIGVPVSQTLGSGSPRAYAASMADLWIDLSRALARLDALSATPDLLQEEQDQLPGLQYELHCAAELVAGMTPPDGAELIHEELTDALMDGREATAEIAEALEHGGPDAAAPLVWEWRGALFRVRYARLRLERPRRTVPAPVSVVARPLGRSTFPLTACAVALGSFFVLLAALLGLWLLVALTLAGTLAASILLHP